MKPHNFTVPVELCHRRWLCSLFDLSATKNGGIDLYAGNTFIELKSGLRIPGKINERPPVFSVRHDQISGYKRRYCCQEFMGQSREDIDTPELYFALLAYNLGTDINQIEGGADLEQFIHKREVWIVPWEFVESKLKNQKIIERITSRQKSTLKYRYVTINGSKIKKEFELKHGRFMTIEKRGGIIHLPKESSLIDRLEEYSPFTEPRQRKFFF